MAAAVLAYPVAKIVIAVPVASPEVCDEFRAEVDEIVCGMTPDPFYAVGLWYEDFSPTSDEEVRELLERARRRSSARQEQQMMNASEPARSATR